MLILSIVMPSVGCGHHQSHSLTCESPPGSRNWVDQGKQISHFPALPWLSNLQLGPLCCVLEGIRSSCPPFCAHWLTCRWGCSGELVLTGLADGSLDWTTRPWELSQMPLLTVVILWLLVTESVPGEIILVTSKRWKHPFMSQWYAGAICSFCNLAAEATSTGKFEESWLGIWKCWILKNQLLVV